jgi:hypothetical protein
MKFRYITIYQIRGLIHNSDEGDIEIYAKENHGASVRAILTDQPDQYCYDIDRAQSIGYLMLTSMVGQRGTDDVKLEIKTEIERIRENRKKELQGLEAFIFIAEGETDVDFSHPNKETDDYVLGFDIINKDNIISPYRDQINAALVALCLATERVPLDVKHLRGDVYLINEISKPVYSIAFSGSGEGYPSIQTTAEIIKEAQGQIKLISKRPLTKVYRLLTQAISRDNDELRRFMFGWAALETLIKTVFSEYEKLFVQSLLEADPASQAGRYFKRIREVMKGKYNIADQFVVVAACIGEGPVEPDIQEFIRIKKIRDTLFHDTSVAEKGLPTVVTVELLKKYLRLHIRYKDRLTTPSTRRGLSPV